MRSASAAINLRDEYNNSLTCNKTKHAQSFCSSFFLNKNLPTRYALDAVTSE